MQDLKLALVELNLCLSVFELLFLNADLMFGNRLRYARAHTRKSADLLSLKCLKRLLDLARISFLDGLLKLTIEIFQALSQLDINLLELVYLLTTK